MEFVCFLRYSEQTENFAFPNIKSLVFIAEVESVYWAVRKGSLYNGETFGLWKVKYSFKSIMWHRV